MLASYSDPTPTVKNQEGYLVAMIPTEEPSPTPGYPVQGTSAWTRNPITSVCKNEWDLSTKTTGF